MAKQVRAASKCHLLLSGFVAIQLITAEVYAADRGVLGVTHSLASQISAFYMFRSWESADKVVMILNVSSGQNPANGPAYPGFGDDMRYRVNIDNDLDGVADDFVYEVRFKTEHRRLPEGGGFPWSYLGNPALADPDFRGIVALDGPGSEGLVTRQSYTVTEYHHGERRELFAHRRLVAIPSNVGPATMPSYEALAAQGIYKDEVTGIRIFAGTRAETAYSDTGALFDSAHLRRAPPFLMPEEDNSNSINPFGIDRYAGTNVQSIALEIPSARITRDGKSTDATESPMIGAYASVHQKRSSREGTNKNGSSDDLVQVSRMGNPSFRTFIVDSASKARWDAAKPEHDAQFQEFLKVPAVAPLLSSATGLPVPPNPRLELVQIIFKYPGQALNGSNCGVPCADLLRLNIKIPPTPPDRQHRLGALLSPDPAGLPNGCRPNDDITDISLRAFGGPAFFAARVGDGVNFADGVPGAGTSDGPGYGRIPGNQLDVNPTGIVKEFPFMPTPYRGR